MVPCPGGLPESAQVVEAQRPDIVVLTDEASYKLVVDRLLDVSGAGFRIAGLATFFEYAFGRVPLPHVTRRCSWASFICASTCTRACRESLRHRSSPHAAPLLAPLLPCARVPGLAGTDGPMVYRQTRLGEGGRPFTVYKFRTMIPEAEAARPCRIGRRSSISG